MPHRPAGCHEMSGRRVMPRNLRADPLSELGMTLDERAEAAQVTIRWASYVVGVRVAPVGGCWRVGELLGDKLLGGELGRTVALGEPTACSEPAGWSLPLLVTVIFMSLGNLDTAIPRSADPLVPLPSLAVLPR